MSEIVTIPKVVKLSDFSLGFPLKNWTDLIERENFIESIESHFQNGKNIVFVSGERGSGKSTLLAQFSQKNYNNTLSVFFNPFHDLDLNLNYLRSNLIGQINFLLNPNYQDDEEIISPDKYRMALLNLKKKFRSSKEYVYLIIDGLEDRKSSEKDLVQKIMDELPFGENHIKIIISGSTSNLKNLHKSLSQQDYQEINIVGFNKYQIRKFLSAHEEILNHHGLIKVTKGYPGRLEVLRSLLDQGYTINEIPNTDNFKNWIDLDTDKIDLSNTKLSLILSLLIFSNKNFTIIDLSQILEAPFEEIEEIVRSVHVIELTNEVVQFNSQQYSEYFKNLLRGNKLKVQELLIRFYSSSNSLVAKFELSKIYQYQKKWSKITKLIDQGYITATIQSTGTIEEVCESLNLGYLSAEKMKEYSKVYEYAYQGSIINELDNYSFWESEIMARISLQDFAGAIGLAEKAVLKVDRLRLLCLIAKNEKQINNKVDEELISLIQDLYQNTNLVGIGESIYDIVSNLIYAVPNLAIEMIEKTSGAVSESNINDWIVAKLSIAAINSSNENEEKGEKEKKFKAIEKLNNPSVKKIHRAISLMVGKYSATKVLEEVNKLNDSNEKLKLLRLWLKNNKQHTSGLVPVIDATFSELISFTSDSDATLDTLVDLSSQLGNIRNKKEIKRILSRFRDFEKNIQGVGFGKDYYVYKLNIFHSLSYLNTENSEATLNSIISDIQDIEDILIRVEAYSEVFYKLTIIKQNRYAKYFNIVHGRLKKEVEVLLNNTANHYKLTENLLNTIGKVDYKFSLEICQNINTSYGRDRARLRVMDSYLNNALKFVEGEGLKKTISSFENTLFIEIAIESLLERFSASQSLPFLKVKEILPFINEIDKFSNQVRKVECSILTYQIVNKNTEWEKKLSEKWEKKIVKYWSEIEADWNRIDFGFRISSQTSKINLQFARSVFEETLEMKSQNWLDSKSIAKTYIYSLRLVLKSFAGLIKNYSSKDRDFIVFENLVNRIPSEIEKLLIWTELAINIILSDNSKDLKRIYDNHIIPLLSSIITNKKEIHLVLESIVVVHFRNPQLAEEYLNLLDQPNKEDACIRIIDFYINYKNPFEFYEGDINNSNISYDDLFKAVELLKEIKTDNIIYLQTTEIRKAINNATNVSKQQKTELKGKIIRALNTALPDLKNILHEGYKILGELETELIQNEDTLHYKSFINRAKLITNLSDRLFINGNLLENIPFEKVSNGTDLKKEIIITIYQDLGVILSHYEFVEKVIYLSKIMYENDRKGWQKQINEAFDISHKFEEGVERYDYQRDIIDTMYRIDASFAKQLVNNKNNSNSSHHKLIKDYYDTLEFSKKIKNNQSLEDLKQQNYRKIVSAIARANGSLNSGKISTKKISDVAKYLEIGKNVPLSDCYPVFEYFLTNAMNLQLRPKQKSEIIDIQRKVFENLVKALELIEILSYKKKSEHSLSIHQLIDQNFEKNLVINPNSKEEAINFIREWILDEVQDFVIIVDPYLKKEGIEILKFFKELDDNEVDIQFLGCEVASNDSQEEFENYWKKISDEEAPFSKFIFCWVAEDKSKKPIHDRWIISRNGGLRLGTSFNGLGKKESEISIMKPNEAFNILENTVNGYISNKTKYLNNQKLKYFSFTL